MRATRKLFLLSSMDFSRRHSWAWPCDHSAGACPRRLRPCPPPRADPRVPLFSSSLRQPPHPKQPSPAPHLLELHCTCTGPGRGSSPNCPLPESHPVPTKAPPHQHEVDIESEDLAAHVDAVGLREVLAQVGKGACRALEVSAGDLHPLGGERGRVAGGGARPLPCPCPRGRAQCDSADWEHSAALVRAPVPYPSLPAPLTSSDTRLSMAPSMECSAPGEAEDTALSPTSRKMGSEDTATLGKWGKSEAQPSPSVSCYAPSGGARGQRGAPVHRPQPRGPVWKLPHIGLQGWLPKLSPEPGRAEPLRPTAGSPEANLVSCCLKRPESEGRVRSGPAETERPCGPSPPAPKHTVWQPPQKSRSQQGGSPWPKKRGAGRDVGQEVGTWNPGASPPAVHRPVAWRSAEAQGCRATGRVQAAHQGCRECRPAHT